nr:hypothetical protein [uncultured Shewanella sp.]
MTPSDLSKLLPTKSKTRLAGSYGQCLWLLSTALSLVYVEQLHHTSSALYKEPTNCCRNHHQSSTGPSQRSHQHFSSITQKRTFKINNNLS